MMSVDEQKWFDGYIKTKIPVPEVHFGGCQRNYHAINICAKIIYELDEVEISEAVKCIRRKTCFTFQTAMKYLLDLNGLYEIVSLNETKVRWTGERYVSTN